MCILSTFNFMLHILNKGLDVSFKNVYHNLPKTHFSPNNYHLDLVLQDISK